jgi:signal peptidase I
MNIRKLLYRLLNWGMNIFLILCAGFVLFQLIHVFCYTSFRVPTGSMIPALIPGDVILVEKLQKGARLFNVLKALKGEEVSIHRMPGFGDWKRNDILAFNFPYPEDDYHIKFDVMKYFVKRCVALPGDTLEIRGGFYKVRGTGEPLGNIQAQQELSTLPDSTTRVWMSSYPWDAELSWTVKEFGPLPVPAKGQIAEMSLTNFLLYRPLIEWEQRKPLLRNNIGEVTLGDSLITRYRFEENYYFMAGDNVLDSRDSRYWGMLPESFIVGKAVRVWNSVDKATKRVRWERVMLKLK